MAAPTQAQRRIAINTALGEDVLLARRCTIRDQMSRLFEVELDLYSQQNDINFDEIIGTNATLLLRLEGRDPRYFNGFVSRFMQVASERSYSCYRATLVPWLW